MLQLADVTGRAGLCWRSPASLSEAKSGTGRDISHYTGSISNEM